ncbi:MAG: hypothetical protein LBO05_06830 [Deltaproteobacteria bacterium]|jgi:hypothetical protein|nr:hypothetical protein [Deltaproteobacteria bacterium]
MSAPPAFPKLPATLPTRREEGCEGRTVLDGHFLAVVVIVIIIADPAPVFDPPFKEAFVYFADKSSFYFNKNS